LIRDNRDIRFGLFGSGWTYHARKKENKEKEDNAVREIGALIDYIFD
jgi:hypothetical protein